MVPLSHRLVCGALLLAPALACLRTSEILTKLAQPPSWASVSGEVYEISLSSQDGRDLFDIHGADLRHPDEAALMKTDAARVHRKDGRLVIGFCIDTEGNTTAAVVEGFSTDPTVDEIVRKAVDEWTFYPFRIHGKPVVVCGEHTFILEFS
jgi:hypothetical protein